MLLLPAIIQLSPIKIIYYYQYTKKIREEAKILTDKELGIKNATNYTKWNITYTNHMNKIKEGEEYKDKLEKYENKKAKIYEDIKSLRKEIAQDTYTPEKLAGKNKEENMTHEQADKGMSNPFYNKATNAYRENCQSCVVAYEARRRGYNVRAGAYEKGNKLDILSASTKDAWIDRQTGDVAKPDEDFWDKKNYKEINDLLNKKVEEGKRYNISFLWRNKSSNIGHVISVEKNKDGLFLYDPQNNTIMRGKEIETYLRRIKTGDSFEFYRVDNKSFNPEFMDDILRGNEDDKKG